MAYDTVATAAPTRKWKTNRVKNVAATTVAVVAPAEVVSPPAPAEEVPAPAPTAKAPATAAVVIAPAPASKLPTGHLPNSILEVGRAVGPLYIPI